MQDQPANLAPGQRDESLHSPSDQTDCAQREKREQAGPSKCMRGSIRRVPFPVGFIGPVTSFRAVECRSAQACLTTRTRTRPRADEKFQYPASVIRKPSLCAWRVVVCGEPAWRADSGGIPDDCSRTDAGSLRKPSAPKCASSFSAPRSFIANRLPAGRRRRAASDACGAGATGDFLISSWADPGIMKSRLTIAVR